ncbi:MAG: bifunctional 5,10-methylene-tetrahydrofolate dehydrogenase/5,10-methylene-tetrahydrofolate cyclohydrolase [Prevotellaceae bacterium]|jgi:methylenetetrahydrofolate dehydrogenase (NADP+)/methenyltetrahydrofolate cyclohydrolase|nr:bifunctional 5,10-methylene-tetrahydrofolate dehydrogenase/5,10-methylene-tetrahydrofolate cyclohydrolase [Prevotellaceae bacterium]
MQIIDGKKIASEIKLEIANEVKEIIAKGHRAPCLAAILVGNDPASETYVNSKEKDCYEAGFTSKIYRLSEQITESELIEKIKEINANDNIDGLIVQLPLPGHISENNILLAIDYRKDVDGFHPQNVGRLMLGLPTYVSATPDGIAELLARYDIETSGKNCVVIGRSNIVGRPVANLLSRRTTPGDCTVTICHSHTKNIKEICANADIIIAALGVAEFLQADMVKDGAVVIDVGTTRIKTESGKYRLVGDVNFSEVAPKCSYITPVPGGVGPMTRISLLKNTLKAAKKEIYKQSN